MGLGLVTLADPALYDLSMSKEELGPKFREENSKLSSILLMPRTEVPQKGLNQCHAHGQGLWGWAPMLPSGFL